MTWNQRYALRSYIRSSLWVPPFFALVLEQATTHVLLRIDAWMRWVPDWPFSTPATLVMIQSIVTLVLSFLVFTFGSMLVAIQVASGQLTPRIIATTLLRDNVVRFTVGLLVFALLLAIGTLARLDAGLPDAHLWATALLGFASIIAFLYLIDYAARLLRPVSIVWRIGEQGIAVIKTVYPNPIEEEAPRTRGRPELGPPDRTITHSGTSAIVLGCNIQAIVAEATRADALIEFVPRVGDFVAVGDPLYRVYGGLDQQRLMGLVAFGPERTIEQDSTFAFRVIVDIALKALSKAINDPTTAVLAIDQLQRLLRLVGLRHLHDDQVRDASGRVRLIFPTPNWEDFVQLTFSEIRLHGAGEIQIARRLRAMIDNLIDVLPERRRPALAEELALLDRAIERLYPFPEDRALARTPDTQGLGGASPVPQAA